MTSSVPGYMGQMLRVDLSKGKSGVEALPGPDILRQYLGGTGLGLRILYEEVPPVVGAYDPENRIIFGAGPLGGTIGGTGTFSVVTKGPMTNGALTSQANGFTGAFMKFAGFDGIIIQGKAAEPVYIYVHDGQAELKDARHLRGKDTWETEDLIAQELGKRTGQISIFAIGPAGENRVRFSAIMGDKGHAVAHGGPGAVMASKNLKAIAVARGQTSVSIHDKEKLDATFKVMLEEAHKYPSEIYKWGTSLSYSQLAKTGRLPVKNYLESVFPQTDIFTGPRYREHMERKRTPCWACHFDHCGIVKITDGPYAGYIGEEPEYECFVSCGCLINQTDPTAAVVLSNEIDRLGMDVNETGWLIAWVMECYEKGLLTKKDTDGLEMTWGNVEATRAMLRKIAYREGIGDLLAEGVMRAAEHLGGEAARLAIYSKKGNTPRGHDHRSSWCMILDVCTSNSSTDEAGVHNPAPVSLGLPADTDPYTAEGTAAMLAAVGHKFHFHDSIGICRLTLFGTADSRVIEALNAVTGWDFSSKEVTQFGHRMTHLLRAFNVRHGLTPDLEAPSQRYASTAIQGTGKGKAFLDVFEKAKEHYYKQMGWEIKTGRPLPETLRRHSLDYVIKDIW